MSEPKRSLLRVLALGVAVGAAVLVAVVAASALARFTACTMASTH